MAIETEGSVIPEQEMSDENKLLVLCEQLGFSEEQVLGVNAAKDFDEMLRRAMRIASHDLPEQKRLSTGEFMNKMVEAGIFVREGRK